MLKNANRKAFLQWCRLQTMEAMKVGLRVYKGATDPLFKEDLYKTIKSLGEQSVKYKQEIETL